MPFPIPKSCLFLFFMTAVLEEILYQHGLAKGLLLLLILF